MTQRTSCELLIVEGPDGGGKSTLAKAWARATGARYVHLPSLPQVSGKALARLYLEAMLPALHGYQPVVLDRCWLSEEPYGLAFRPGQPLRVVRPQMRILERIAMRCAARVVYCLPPVETCLETYRQRKGQEMLTCENELANVCGVYHLQVQADLTQLSSAVYDRTKLSHQEMVEILRQTCEPEQLHPLAAETVGNRLAPVCLVGEAYAERTDADAWQQYPFSSLGSIGCSRWLAEHLSVEQIREDQLCWINADQLNYLTAVSLKGKNFIALGGKASGTLNAYGIDHVMVSHPQYQKRFNAHERYDLGSSIRTYLDAGVAGAAQADPQPR